MPLDGATGLRTRRYRPILGVRGRAALGTAAAGSCGHGEAPVRARQRPVARRLQRAALLFPGPPTVVQADSHGRWPTEDRERRYGLQQRLRVFFRIRGVVLFLEVMEGKVLGPASKLRIRGNFPMLHMTTVGVPGGRHGMAKGRMGKVKVGKGRMGKAKVGKGRRARAHTWHRS